MLAYFFYSVEKRKVLLQTGLASAVLSSACFYFSVQVPDLSTRLSQLGLFCSVFTISMYLSPLADLVRAAAAGEGETPGMEVRLFSPIATSLISPSVCVTSSGGSY
ncbi:UNVERIFIED_CONTAM: hypothetical protein FKN15_002846 [Acipenser sinensis]